MGPGGKVLGPFSGILLFCLYKVTMHVPSGLAGRSYKGKEGKSGIL